jgi:uncharacterized membrane protein
MRMFVHGCTYEQKTKAHGWLVKPQMVCTMFSTTIRWSTVPVRQEPNKLLVWQSVKGLQLQGRAEFESLEDGQSRMLFTLCYVGPRKVKNSLGSSKKESAQLKLMLESFRDIVAKETK